jgi:hypothetical protein
MQGCSCIGTGRGEVATPRRVPAYVEHGRLWSWRGGRTGVRAAVSGREDDAGRGRRQQAGAPYGHAWIA